MSKITLTLLVTPN